MHPNECRFAAKILKICVHARASVSDSMVRGRDYVSQVNSVSGSPGIHLESLIFCEIVLLIHRWKICVNLKHFTCPKLSTQIFVLI